MAWAGWDRTREIRHMEFCKAAFRISEYLAWRRFHPPNTFMYGIGEAGKVGSNDKAIYSAHRAGPALRGIFVMRHASVVMKSEATMLLPDGRHPHSSPDFVKIPLYPALYPASLEMSPKGSK